MHESTWHGDGRRQIAIFSDPDCPFCRQFDLLALGRRLGATSTPAWFLPDCKKNMGAQPMSKVIPMLDATARRR